MVQVKVDAPLGNLEEAAGVFDHGAKLMETLADRYQQRGDAVGKAWAEAIAEDARAEAARLRAEKDRIEKVLAAAKSGQ